MPDYVSDEINTEYRKQCCLSDQSNIYSLYSSWNVDIKDYKNKNSGIFKVIWKIIEFEAEI